MNSVDLEDGEEAFSIPAALSALAGRARSRRARRDLRRRGPRARDRGPRGAARAAARQQRGRARPRRARHAERGRRARAPHRPRRRRGESPRRAAGRRDRPRLRAPARHRRPRPGRRHLGAHEGLPLAHLPRRVLRPLPQPLADVVLDGRLRQPREGADLPAPGLARVSARSISAPSASSTSRCGASSGVTPASSSISTPWKMLATSVASARGDSGSSRRASRPIPRTPTSAGRASRPSRRATTP